MNREAVHFVFALLPALLWVYLSTSLLLRPPGGKISWKPIGNREEGLTGTRDYLSLGVLGFGVGMFIFELVRRYFQWKLYGASSDQLLVGSVLLLLFSNLLSGVFFGLFLALLNWIVGRKQTTRP